MKDNYRVVRFWVRDNNMADGGHIRKDAIDLKIKSNSDCHDRYINACSEGFKYVVVIKKRNILRFVPPHEIITAYLFDDGPDTNLEKYPVLIGLREE